MIDADYPLKVESLRIHSPVRTPQEESRRAW